MDALVEALQDVVVSEPETEAQPDPTQTDDATIETQLTQQISTLWSHHLRLSADRRATAVELRQIRASLAGRLYEMKTLLSRTGRGGQWRSWLKERGIPRSSADRLCDRHAETLGIKNEIASSEAINLGENAVEQLVRTLVPRLRTKLPDVQAVFRFIAAIAGAFNLVSETTEDCIMFSQRKEQSEHPSSATGAPEAVSAEGTFPGTETSSDGIPVQAESADTNGGGE